MDNLNSHILLHLLMILEKFQMIISPIGHSGMYSGAEECELGTKRTLTNNNKNNNNTSTTSLNFCIPCLSIAIVV